MWADLYFRKNTPLNFSALFQSLRESKTSGHEKDSGGGQLTFNNPKNATVKIVMDCVDKCLDCSTWYGRVFIQAGAPAV